MGKMADFAERFDKLCLWRGDRGVSLMVGHFDMDKGGCTLSFLTGRTMGFYDIPLTDEQKDEAGKLVCEHFKIQRYTARFYVKRKGERSRTECWKKTGDTPEQAAQLAADEAIAALEKRVLEAQKYLVNQQDGLKRAVELREALVKAAKATPEDVEAFRVSIGRATVKPVAP